MSWKVLANRSMIVVLLGKNVILLTTHTLDGPLEERFASFAGRDAIVVTRRHVAAH